jgi:hypothetical protein
VADEILGEVDLFGDPLVRVRERAGRPEHVWTQRNSNRINLLFAQGSDLKEAAAAIGVSVPTLRKHYFSEVAQWKVAALRLRASLLERLNEEAAKGNVAAVKELFAQIERGRIVALSARVQSRDVPARPKLGKKEALRQAAGEVTGRFAPPPAPQLIN